MASSLAHKARENRSAALTYVKTHKAKLITLTDACRRPFPAIGFTSSRVETVRDQAA